MVATKYAKEIMQNQNENGIRLYFEIPCERISDFLNGKAIPAQPLSSNSPNLPHLVAATLINVNPDMVDIKETEGDFIIQRKYTDAKPKKSSDKTIREENHLETL